MKIVEIEDIQNVSDIFIVNNKIDIRELKKIRNFKEKTLILIMKESLFVQEIKEFSKNPNIIIKIFAWNIFKQKHNYRYLSDFDSNNYIDDFLKNLFLQNKNITKFIKNLYQDEKLENAFKKGLLQHLKKNFEIKRVFEKIMELNPKISLLNRNKRQSYFSIFFVKLKNSFYFVFYPLFVIFILISKSRNKSNNPLALRVYNNGLRIENQGYNLDWIKKNNVISEEDILLVVEDNIDKNFLNSLEKSHYLFTYSSKKKPYGNFSLKLLIRIFHLFLISIFKILQFFKAPFFYQKVLLNAWMNFFIWNNFLSSFSPKIYLNYHDYSENHIYKNILLNKKNCKSLAYKHTNSEIVFDIKEKYLAIEFAYNYHDLEVHWTQDSIAMSKANHSKSRKFLLSSPLWSSKEFINVNSIIEDLKIKKHKEKLKIISVFSASFGSPGAYNSVESHYYLLNFLKKILESEKDIFVVFKSKYNIELLNNYLDLKKLMDYLNENRMFKLVNNVRSINLIDISDLTISMAFASPTIEAIALEKRSFYVDLTDNFPNSPYKKIDNFVATSIEDGLNKLEYWLSMDNNKFTNFLNNNIKSRLSLNFNNESVEDIRAVVLKEISKKNKI